MMNKYDYFNEMLNRSNRMSPIIHHLSNTLCHPRLLLIKANLQTRLGQHALALASLQEADHLFVAAEGKGLVNAEANGFWSHLVHRLGFAYLTLHQLEAAKRCFLRILDWPRRISAAVRLDALRGMACYFYERKEWIQMASHCEGALKLLPEAKKDTRPEANRDKHLEARLLILRAYAAEGEGDLSCAREYDEKAWDAYLDSGEGDPPVQIAAYDRREALGLLAAGEPDKALKVLRR